MKKMKKMKKNQLMKKIVGRLIKIKSSLYIKHLR